MNAEELLEQCKRMINHPFANDKDRTALIQTAYELGVADGRLQGKIEMGDELLKTRMAV